MLDDQFFLTEDFQISYNDTISTIELLFDDKIQESLGCGPAGFTEALKDMRQEFTDSFKMILDKVIHLKQSKKTTSV